MQNSGLGNAINPLTSLIAPYSIPLSLIIGWRASVKGTDEPQHHLIGSITRELLEKCGITSGRWPRALVSELHQGSHAYLFESGEIEKSSTDPVTISSRKKSCEVAEWRRQGSHSPPIDYILGVSAIAAEGLPVVATTGFASRELYAAGDEQNFFYQVGSMGCASSIALGIAAESGKSVVVIDGDGAALMRLGAMAAIGEKAPRGLVHLLIDNGVHESTGGQPVAGHSVDFGTIAAACGYSAVARCNHADDLASIVSWAQKFEGPLLIHAQASARNTQALPRIRIPLPELAQRFRNWMQN